MIPENEEDPIVEAVRQKLLDRSAVGFIKYNVGLNRTDLNRLQWMIHLQEELMDACNYLEVIIQKETENEKM